MIKDYAHERLPRFRAGEPLLDQITAQRMNDILAVIESIRLQHGVGYLLNRTAQGTTLAIASSNPYRGPKLWEVDFGALLLEPVGILAKVLKEGGAALLQAFPSPETATALFSGLFGGLTEAVAHIDPVPLMGEVSGLFAQFVAKVAALADAVDGILHQPIATVLSERFQETSPRAGDYLYSPLFGICYTVFPAAEENAFLSQNFIFRVPFTVGKEKAPWYALTLFPSPDIKAFLLELMGLLAGIIIGIVSLLLAALAAAAGMVFVSVLAALASLAASLASLSAAVGSLGASGALASLEALQNAVNGLQESTDSLRQDLQDVAQQAEQNVEDLRQETQEWQQQAEESLEKVKQAATAVVIGADGHSREVSVLGGLSAGSGADLRSNVTVCEGGQSSTKKMLVWG